MCLFLIQLYLSVSPGSPGWHHTPYVAEDDLEPRSSCLSNYECWDYRPGLPHLPSTPASAPQQPPASDQWVHATSPDPLSKARKHFSVIHIPHRPHEPHKAIPSAHLTDGKVGTRWESLA